MMWQACSFIILLVTITLSKVSMKLDRDKMTGGNIDIDKKNGFYWIKPKRSFGSILMRKTKSKWKIKLQENDEIVIAFINENSDIKLVSSFKWNGKMKQFGSTWTPYHYSETNGAYASSKIGKENVQMQCNSLMSEGALITLIRNENQQIYLQKHLENVVDAGKSSPIPSDIYNIKLSEMVYSSYIDIDSNDGKYWIKANIHSKKRKIELKAGDNIVVGYKDYDTNRFILDKVYQWTGGRSLFKRHWYVFETATASNQLKESSKMGKERVQKKINKLIKTKGVIYVWNVLRVDDDDVSFLLIGSDNYKNDNCRNLNTEFAIGDYPDSSTVKFDEILKSNDISETVITPNKHKQLFNTVILCVIVFIGFYYYKRRNTSITQKTIQSKRCKVNKMVNYKEENTEGESKATHKNTNDDVNIDAREGMSYQINKCLSQEVESWLNDIGLKQYYKVFLMNGFDSIEMVKQIQNEKHLNDIGITIMAHRLKIINNIQKIQKK